MQSSKPSEPTAPPTLRTPSRRRVRHHTWSSGSVRNVGLVEQAHRNKADHSGSAKELWHPSEKRGIGSRQPRRRNASRTFHPTCLRKTIAGGGVPKSPQCSHEADVPCTSFTPRGRAQRCSFRTLGRPTRLRSRRPTSCVRFDAHGWTGRSGGLFFARDRWLPSHGRSF